MLSDDALKQLVKPGDLIFTRINYYLFKRVADTYNSWTNHIGFVYSKTDSEVLIAESTIPFSTLTPIEKFVKRSEKRQYSIKRLPQELSTQDLLAIKTATDQRLKKLYALSFKYESKRFYCSKFAFDIYQEALGVKIGQLETFTELLKKNPTISQKFWQLYFFGRIPWDSHTITPGSQYEDGSLRTVAEYLI